jgi:hypothetical protein
MEAKGPNTMPLSVLEAEHYYPLARAISNVLSTDIAKSTFAQIVDGEPLFATVAEYYINPLCDAKPHPISSHTELCHGVLERAEEFRSQFDLSSMRLDSQVRQFETQRRICDFTYAYTYLLYSL